MNKYFFEYSETVTVSRERRCSPVETSLTWHSTLRASFPNSTVGSGSFHIFHPSFLHAQSLVSAPSPSCHECLPSALRWRAEARHPARVSSSVWHSDHVFYEPSPRSLNKWAISQTKFYGLCTYLSMCLSVPPIFSQCFSLTHTLT